MFSALSSSLSNFARFSPNNLFAIQKLNFSKFISKSRAKRLPLSPKRVGKGYYKGNGCRKEGRLTSKGNFIKDPKLCAELIVPDLSNFTLKAYIAPGAKRHITDTVVTLASK